MFVAVLLVAFWLRVANLNTMPQGLHRDEARKMERAWRLIHGYGLPLYFEDIPEPFDIILRAGFLSAAGLMLFTARLFTVFLNVVAVAAVMAAARALYRDHPQHEVIALVAGLALAALPASVVMGRGIYRANWIPPMSMLALAALAWAWRTGRQRYFVAAGAFSALTMMFYLGGLAFPLAVVLVVGFEAIRRFRTPPPSPLPVHGEGEKNQVFWIENYLSKWRHFLLMAVAFGITLLPWLYLYITIPSWLDQRTAEATTRAVNPLEDPAGFVGQVGNALRPIFLPDTYFEPRFNTFTDAFLNPALVVFVIVGLAVSLWRWRRMGMLAPVIIGTVMLLPAALSSEPTRPIRLIGIFGPLALLTGLGAGGVAHFVTVFRREGFQTLRYTRLILQGVLALVLVATPFITHMHVQQHFTGPPASDDARTDWDHMAIYYKLAYRDLLLSLDDAGQPVYFPLDLLNNEFGVAWLRSVYPNTRAFAGGPLPSGDVILPTTRQYDIPDFPLPLQYGLLLPETGEIVILPPLTMLDAESLAQGIRDEGTLLANARGVELGHTLTLDDMPFTSVDYRDGAALGVFDGRLELVDIVTPRTLIPGDWIPVTLYWRLRERTSIDYFTHLQPVDFNGDARGVTNGWISRSIYPTVMWQPGEVVAETRWLRVYEDAPPGGYHFMVGMYTQPGDRFVGALDVNGVADGRLHVGRSVIGLPDFIPPPEAAIVIDAILGDEIRLTHATIEPPLADVAAGATVTVTLYWETLSPPVQDYTLFLHIQDEAGALVAQVDAPPLVEFPTSTWVAGDQFVTTHTLSIPADGSYTLIAGMYTWPSLERLVVVQDGDTVDDGLIRLWP
jgi:hypothetical protein